jgi:hypothetical protein
MIFGTCVYVILVHAFLLLLLKNAEGSFSSGLVFYFDICVYMIGLAIYFTYDTVQK